MSLLFPKRGICSICGQRKGFEVADGFVCNDCFKKSKLPKYESQYEILKNLYVSMVKNRLENIARINSLLQEYDRKFQPSLVIGNQILYDEVNNLWSLSKGTLKKEKSGNAYSIKDIEDYEIIEDGDIITSGGLGSAAIGGLLFGSTGAIVGGTTGKRKTSNICKLLQLKIVLDNGDIALISFIDSKVKKDSAHYTNSIDSLKEIINFINKNAVSIN